MLNSGVYIIINRFNGKCYVGSTTRRFDRRWKEHERLLKRGVNKCYPLQMAYNKYGAKHFEFKIISRVPPEYALRMEQYFIDTFKPEYNVCQVAGNTTGKRIPERGKRIISQKLTGNKNALGAKRSKEYIDKMRAREYNPQYDYFFLDEKGNEYHTNNLASFARSRGINNCNLRHHYLTFLRSGINNFYRGFALIKKTPIKKGQAI